MNGNQMMGRRTGVPEKSKRGIKGVLKELFTYSSKLRLPMIIAFVFSMIGAVLTIIGPNQLSRITDLISDGLMTGIDLSAVAKVGGVLLAIYLIGEVCGYIEQYIMATVTLDLSKKMRRDLSDKINKVPMKCFGKISHGDILSRVTNDVSTLQQALSNSLPSMISAVAQFVGCLIMMLVTEWRMALAAIAITLIGFVVMAVIMSRSQKYFVARQQSLGKLNGYVEEMYSGHDVVRISRANNEIKKNFAGMNRAVYDANRKSQFLSGVMQPLMNVIGNLGYVAVCVIGAFLIGVFRKMYGDYPEEMETVMAKVKTEKHYDYKNMLVMMIAAVLPLLIGSSVGPEAGLTGIIVGMCYWAGDNLKFARQHAKEYSQIGVAASLSVLFHAPLFGLFEVEEHTLEEGKGSPQYLVQDFPAFQVLRQLRLERWIMH